ncbi:ATP-binding protein [Pseudomonas aeruginosa]|uniref:ATP-binding protein n=2 Tax=Pseudomonas aeruginosa TaxID=287 RepID=UPI00053F233E|nr:ATP-binding protein [Pseudomonas aeruginosa]ELI9042928.1 ATP-binding protein [Pseudomonas aeruginosa]MBG4615369.1 ATP-binding protein [Pseudomonas aeruginosa]MBG5659211.1 ATP-binding protein [Pseudomonas aeruginosa]MBG7079136.1 ATP-binding protein [Pseudomonas aeruginosa]MBH9501994.1 ATP-binding protein [Pseudomonas aeruginosa]
MIRLRVKNFGPIGPGLVENDGWIDFKRVTIFIGNQGAGKSTLAKLYSTFAWIEKAVVRGDYERKWFERKGRLKNQFLTYHRLENYLETSDRGDSEFEYEGEACKISYAKSLLSIAESSRQYYKLPQVMYVPAERNFISYVRHPKELKLSSESLKEFLSAFDQAKQSLKESVKLPINDSEIEYDKLNDILNLKGKGHKLRLTDASSGFQSIVPVYLVSQYLAGTIQDGGGESQQSMSAEETDRFKKEVASIFANLALTEEQKRAAISVLSSRFNKQAFINIVEEPEQNLFPSSQWDILKSLLAFNSQGEYNRLVLTTHSPYVVNYLSLAIQGRHLQKRLIEQKREDLLSSLYDIVPEEALLQADDVAIYQCNERDGSITQLPCFEGIPSDSNLLNNWLRVGNELFDKLLELEEAI